MRKKIIYWLILHLTNIVYAILSLLIDKQELIGWKPVHLCWWFEKNNFPIPPYFIGTHASSSVSPSVSPSSSVSPSESPSVSPSSSVSPSPSVGYQGYTRGDYAALPGNDNDLETDYTGQDIIDVADDDATRVSQSATAEHAIHQYKDWTGATGSVDLTWNGQTNTATTWSTVYLQIYNHDSTAWENVDSESLEAEDTDFTLSGNIPDTTNYVSGGVISCRIYQEAA